jgi:NAD(P)-dependent dehydrogenase (short-subunit alcohol dehydrogenase family)
MRTVVMTGATSGIGMVAAEHMRRATDAAIGRHARKAPSRRACASPVCDNMFLLMFYFIGADVIDAAPAWRDGPPER